MAVQFSAYGNLEPSQRGVEANFKKVELVAIALTVERDQFLEMSVNAFAQVRVGKPLALLGLRQLPEDAARQLAEERFEPALIIFALRCAHEVHQTLVRYVTGIARRPDEAALCQL